MFTNNFFTISDFAKLMGISRQTLIYYDRIGLFKPIKTLKNGYRLYSQSQINIINLILMLSEMGVPLKEIKSIINRISPDTAIKVLEKQRLEAQKQLRRLKMLEEMMTLRIKQITLGKTISEKPALPVCFIEISKDIPLYLSKTLNCSWNDISESEIIAFYSKCEALKFPLIFSGGQVKSWENILTDRTDIISNIGFRLSSRTDANSVIPKGTYAVGYVRGNCENTGSIYREMLSYIEKNGRRITGNAYEEYLIDELSEVDPSKFVMKILIRIE